MERQALAIMRYIEPHAHMVSRVTDDYQAMTAAGCVAVCEPAFWAGFDRSAAAGFYDYFCQLTEHEPRRAAKFGLPHYCWLCINPKESEDVELAREVIDLIPKFLERANVLGIGALGPRLLQRAGVEVVELPEMEVCCGFGGGASIDHPEVSRGIVRRKLDNVTSTGASVLCTDNPGCVLHLRGAAHAAGLPIDVRHVAEILAQVLNR